MDKNYYDLIWAWFQWKSNWSGEKRIVKKKDASFIAIAEDVGINRKSVSKYVSYLLDQGLLIYDDKNKEYILRELPKQASSLISYQVLSKLIHSLSHNSVSIYNYLLNRYIANEEVEFIITHKQLKDYLGLSSSSSSNNQVITDILDVLDRLGLITMELRYVEPTKTYIYITNVTNVLPDIDRVVYTRGKEPKSA